MKKIILVMALFGALTAPAQDVNSRADVQFGPILIASKTTLDSYISLIQHDDNSYLFLCHDKDNFVFETLDGQMTPIKSKSLPRPTFHDKELFLHSSSSNGKDLLMLFRHEDKKEDKVYLLAQRVNLDDLDYVGKLEVIEENSYEKRKYMTGYSTVSSRESSKFLVYTSRPGEKGVPENYSLRVFGEGMKELWQRDVELPYPGDKFERQDMAIDEGGNVFMVGKHYEKSWKEAKKDETVPYKYHVLGVYDNGGTVKDYEIDLGDKYIRTLGMTLADNGDILTTGVYANSATTGVKGTFFVRIDRTTKKVVTQSTRELDYEFLTEELTDKQKAKLEKNEDKAENFGINNFVLRQMVLHNDGSLSLVGEPYYSYTTCYTDSKGNTRCVTHYVYGDIITIRTDQDGNILWTKRIQKYQHTTGSSFASSYNILPDGKSLYFVFNDNPKNMLPPKPGKKPNSKRFTYTAKAIATYLAEVNDEGMVRQSELFKHEKKAPYFLPNSSTSLDDRLILYLRRGKNVQFCSVKMK